MDSLGKPSVACVFLALLVTVEFIVESAVIIAVSLLMKLLT